MPNETLTGDDAIVARVLEKVELAARRANAEIFGATSADMVLHNFSNELLRIVKDMRNGR